MRYLSVCSGIEAASVAWKPLGWRASAYAEIDPFPSTLLHVRYGAGRPHHMPSPDAEGLNALERRTRRAAISTLRSLPLVEPGGPRAPNLGDISRFREWPDLAADILVGGTPCQGFSVAGFREGLADPRSNLLLTYLAVAAKYRPRWLVWENVPGAMSTNGGRDFGALLWGLGQLGYGFAWRLLDAQFCRASILPRAVPQRRRRVFVVGYLGDWRRAAAVLFDRACLRGDTPPRRQAGQGIAADVVASLTASGRGVERAGETRGQDPVVAVPELAVAFGGGNTAGPLDAAACLTGRGFRIDFEVETFLAAPIAFGSKDSGLDALEDVSPPLRAGGFDASHANAGVPPAVAFDFRGRPTGGQFEGPHDTASMRAASGGSSKSYVAQQWGVRRLTPTECERLQGFPDGWTQVPYRGKPASDGPRYKALGNSMAVNVMTVLGERIALVDAVEG